MKIIKKYRYTIIFILIFLLIVCLGVKLKEVLTPDNNKEAYGNRLNNIDDYQINKSLYTKISSEMKKNTQVLDVTHRVQGKIINFIVTLSDKVNINDAKLIGDKILTYFGEKELGYYSIQIYLRKENEKMNNFPIIGIKNPKEKKLSWTKNRDITESEEKNDK